MKNTIAERIADFLKVYPPFNLLTKSELGSISKEVEVLYLEKGQFIFTQQDKPHPLFYIINKGAVKLTLEENEENNILDICDEGDIFGLRPLMTKENYLLNAETNEESIIYGIPLSIFKPLSEKNKSVKNYLITSFASNIKDTSIIEGRGNVSSYIKKETNNDLFNLQKATYTKKPITCKNTTTVKEVAIGMRDLKIGAMVVARNKKPIGIITSKDLRNKVATGDFKISSSAEEIMSSPVITSTNDITIPEAHIMMLKHSASHICITKDGTPKSKLTGILSLHDLIVSLGNNPSVLIKEIKRAKKSKHLRAIREKVNLLLKTYLEQELPFPHILNIISEINTAIICRCIELCLEKMETPPPVKFTWLALGSQGRKEQLLMSDQDNALIFEDVSQTTFKETQDYFILLSIKIVKYLNTIGYEYCPADMMASNPKWCTSLTEWKKQFNDWIINPDGAGTLLSSIFFDYEYIFGEKELTEKLGRSLFKTINKHKYFLSKLGKDVIDKPSPVGFFRQFILETNGDQQEVFNIKIRALMPLIDAARILILFHNVKNSNNTLNRYKKLAELEPQNEDLYNSCARAFRTLLKFKTEQGILNNDSGKLINLESLSKTEKLKLKRAFKPLKEIQELLILRFNLKQML
jgi:CBS domain-containing protein